MKIYRNITWLGWALFILCLALPSVPVGNDGTMYGFQAGVFAVFFIPAFFESMDSFFVAVMGIGNIIALISPLLLLKPKKTICFVSSVLLLLAFVSAVKLSFTGYGLKIGTSFDIGYYVWVVSFFLLSIGINKIGKIIN